MDRQRLFAAWKRHYGLLPVAVAAEEMRQRAGRLEGRMRLLALWRGNDFKGFNKRSLTTALGMALGVHKQLLWGLTSVPWWGRLRVVGGNRLTNRSPSGLH